MLPKIIAALYPILVFIALVFVFKFFRLRHLTNRRLKIPDVYTLFLILGLKIFSSQLVTISILPYYFLIVSGLALVLLLLDVFYYRAFVFRRFLKLWWRVTFIITFVMYLGFLIVIFMR
ncbi:DUF3397 domain-containing protein [Lactococcus fujiensis]|uniref:Lipoprotein n=1 Tax=Lactococcus fujiensis JCM 16395 TaxID=1291764 RepID=A0A2A5RMW5_9LACT|nr:DUF3397 domain-containing protein [Lactococcus fujiensis]PCS00661.1 hypothetical protein RT41_GL001043 [Lactococcus fujiensis JCM 16395]